MQLHVDVRYVTVVHSRYAPATVDRTYVHTPGTGPCASAELATLLSLAREEMRSGHSADTSKLLRARSTAAENCLYLGSFLKSPSPAPSLSISVMLLFV